MAERKSVSEMLADLAREAGLLLCVFIPVDGLISGRVTYALVGLFLFGVLCILGGVALERRRR